MNRKIDLSSIYKTSFDIIRFIAGAIIVLTVSIFCTAFLISFVATWDAYQTEKISSSAAFSHIGERALFLIVPVLVLTFCLFLFKKPKGNG